MTTKIFKAVGVFGILFLSLLSIPTLAFETETGDAVTISEPRTNLHVSAGEVTVNSDITKDLVVAGGQVTINSSVNRNLLAAGGQVEINGQVGGASRIAGGEVTLEGEFNDDVIIGAGTVTISNATIQGDLVVGAGSLSLENSNVTGDIYAGYDEYTGSDLESQVAGEIKEAMIDKPSEEEQKENRLAGKIMSVFFRELSAIVALIVLIVFLSRRKRLHIPSLNFNGRFAIDVLVGVATVVILPIILIIASALFFPITIPVIAILIAMAFLSTLFLPVYIGNLLKNSVFKNSSIRNVVIATYVGLVLFHILKVAFPPFQILNIALLIFIAGNFGFLLRKKYNAINTYLTKR